MKILDNLKFLSYFKISWRQYSYLKSSTNSDIKNKYKDDKYKNLNKQNTPMSQNDWKNLYKNSH